MPRYTITYTPSADRILPPPSKLHLRIKNTSAIPLRAAYLHGPYTLYVAAYPSTFDPDKPHAENAASHGAPEFEPNLKAGGTFSAVLVVPESVRATAEAGRSRQSIDEGRAGSFSWTVEIASQVIFSSSASVHFELLIGRDEKSVELAFAGASPGKPGQVQDHLPPATKGKHKHVNGHPPGVYSRAIKLSVADTTRLWSTPAFPSWEDIEDETEEAGSANPYSRPRKSNDVQSKRRSQSSRPRKQKKVHLVVLTHGLHSNLGADMLYLKESIDKAAKQAREDSRKAKDKANALKKQKHSTRQTEALSSSAWTSAPELDTEATRTDMEEEEEEEEEDDESDDDEEVIVRGFSGNAVRTERGIQYLGKRLAKFVLSITYPDQPYLPVKNTIKKSIANSLSGSLRPQSVHTDDGTDIENELAHHGSTIHNRPRPAEDHPYKITSISFIGHSLGGLVQTYAIAYIQKHSPDFFDIIKPINFIGMASPFLGLSNENPMYVKFALDFGVIGRTGQDLGLTWRAPTIARSGWGAMIGGLSHETQKAHRQPDPGSKPLLRILPTGPAHLALKKFRNRTVYSNVVNDGIVPLRTSCLLFLDWRGLGRVDKVRRENGLVGTMAGWGWAELTGQNTTARTKDSDSQLLSPTGTDASYYSDDEGKNTPTRDGRGETVPQPDEAATTEDTAQQSTSRQGESGSHHYLENTDGYGDDVEGAKKQMGGGAFGSWTSFFSFFRPGSAKTAESQHPQQPKKKSSKIYRRGQTMRFDDASSTTEDSAAENPKAGKEPSRNRPVRGDSLYQDEEVFAPPKTTIFESAGDVLNPPLPPSEFILDPAKRPRTIFHDRIYHPQDIPPPPMPKRRTGLNRTISSTSLRQSGSGAELDQSPVKETHNGSFHPSSPDSRPQTASSQATIGTMKVEEKIARGYHKDLSWRKVLVRLEPDAHNNIVVRRMFANAYGWPVIKHLVDTHFAYTYSAETEDSQEVGKDRAKGLDNPPTNTGEEVEGQHKKPAASPTSRTNASNSAAGGKGHARTPTELNEVSDTVGDLVNSGASPANLSTSLSSSAGHSLRLALDRQGSFMSESGRWSDRFFEGTDDEFEDEEAALSGYEMHGKRYGSGSMSIPHHRDDSGRTLPGRRQNHDDEDTPSSPAVASMFSSSPTSLKDSESLVKRLPASRKSKSSLNSSSSTQTLSPTSPTVPNSALLSLTGVGIGVGAGGGAGSVRGQFEQNAKDKSSVEDKHGKGKSFSTDSVDV